MLLKISKHCINERRERLTAIIQTVDLGEEMACFTGHNEFGEVLEVITTTGVLILKSPVDGMVITAYMITIEKASAIYKRHGYSRVPTALEKTIKNNIKKRGFLFNI